MFLIDSEFLHCHVTESEDIAGLTEAHCAVHINTALTNHKHWSLSTGWCFSCEETITHEPLFILHFHNHIFYTESKYKKLLNANSKCQDYTFHTLFSNSALKRKRKTWYHLFCHAKMDFDYIICLDVKKPFPHLLPPAHCLSDFNI